MKITGKPVYLDEGLQELVGDAGVYEDDLQGGAALAVKRESAESALLYRDGEVRVRQDDRRVLRLEPEAHAQSVRLWMLLLERVRRLRKQRLKIASCNNITRTRHRYGTL